MRANPFLKPGRCLVFALLLTGCASAPPSSARNEASNESLPVVESVGRIDTVAQRCVALAMYWEARGEGREGMLAVGSVVLNRVDDERFPDSVCGVVYQGGETPPCQFSWWCDGKSDRPTQQSAWLSSLDLARELLTDRPRDPTDGALFFHNTSIKSPWRRQRTARIGNHVFYR
jgi:N-acetylmuramoyl-L-alanine amidase